MFISCWSAALLSGAKLFQYKHKVCYFNLRPDVMFTVKCTKQRCGNVLLHYERQWPVATVAMKTSYFTDGYEAEGRQVLLVQLLLSALYISRPLTGGL